MSIFTWQHHLRPCFRKPCFRNKDSVNIQGQPRWVQVVQLLLDAQADPAQRGEMWNIPKMRPSLEANGRSVGHVMGVFDMMKYDGIKKMGIWYNGQWGLEMIWWNMMALNIWDMIKFGQKKKLYELYDEELLVSGKSPKWMELLMLCSHHRTKWLHFPASRVWWLEGKCKIPIETYGFEKRCWETMGCDGIEVQFQDHNPKKQHGQANQKPQP